MGQQFGQVFGVIVVVFVDVVQKVDQPVTEVYFMCFATAQHGIHNGCIFGRPVVAAEQPVFSAQCDGPDRIFAKVVVYLQLAVQVIAREFVVNVISVPEGFPDSSFGQDFRIFSQYSLFKSYHDGVRQPGAQFCTLFI